MQTNHGGSSGDNPSDSLDIYRNAISFVMATDYVDEDVAAGTILKELNGYSNSLLLYQMRAGVIALRALRKPTAIRWEKAWVN